MVKTGWRSLVIYRIRDEQQLVRSFRQHNSGTGKFSVLAKHGNHYHAAHYERSGSYPWGRALTRRENRAGVKSRSMRCAHCLLHYLRKGERHILVHEAGDGSEGIGRQPPACYVHSAGPEDDGHGDEPEHDDPGYTPDCERGKRKMRLETECACRY